MIVLATWKKKRYLYGYFRDSDVMIFSNKNAIEEILRALAMWVKEADPRFPCCVVLLLSTFLRDLRGRDCGNDQTWTEQSWWSAAVKPAYFMRMNAVSMNHKWDDLWWLTDLKKHQNCGEYTYIYIYISTCGLWLLKSNPHPGFFDQLTLPVPSNMDSCEIGGDPLFKKQQHLTK